MTTRRSRSSGSSSSKMALSSGRAEMRFEDIDSEEADEESGEELPFEIETERGGDRARQSNSGTGIKPSRRQSPPTVRDDIFSAAGKSSSPPTLGPKAKVPGAKGAPPIRASSSSSSTHHIARERIAEAAETPIVVRNREKRPRVEGQDDEGRRQPAGSVVKTARRTSLLKDGTPAYPHPKISDGDLYRHCSGEMPPQQRVKHVVGWTLERSRNELKRSGGGSAAGGGGGLSAKYRAPLMAALKLTLRDLNRETLQIDWNARHKTNGKDRRKKTIALPPHPRNEANRKAESQLVKVVERMEREEGAWKEAERELESFEQETERLRVESRMSDDNDDGLLSLEAILSHSTTNNNNNNNDVEWSAEDKTQLQLARRALEGKRIGGAAGNNDGGIAAAAPPPQLGTDDDERWKEIEFRADVLRSKAHSYAQLSSLSQRYLDAVSARGARALHEMTQAPSTLARSSRHFDPASSGPSSTTSLESRDNLERILSSIRTIEDEAASQWDRPSQRDPNHGDTSEGDILRAIAELS